MPWDPHYYLPFTSGTAAVPRFELLETCWRVVGPRQRPIICAIYDVDGLGVEVRVGYSFDDFHRAERVADLTAARSLADAWRQRKLSKGFFSELP
jgi:hypothetical protein